MDLQFKPGNVNGVQIKPENILYTLGINYLRIFQAQRILCDYICRSSRRWWEVSHPLPQGLGKHVTNKGNSYLDLAMLSKADFCLQYFDISKGKRAQEYGRKEGRGGARESK